jgi:hypothetical protein
MTTTTTNLWPELSLDEVVRSPKMILNEQALFLSNITKNILSVKVKTRGLGGGPVAHEFDIVAPNLNGYSYNLLNVEQRDILSSYPCKIYSTDKNNGESVENEEELLQKLKLIFSSHETQRVISSLISQSKLNLNS